MSSKPYISFIIISGTDPTYLCSEGDSPLHGTCSRTRNEMKGAPTLCASSFLLGYCKIKIQHDCWIFVCCQICAKFGVLYSNTKYCSPPKGGSTLSLSSFAQGWLIIYTHDFRRYLILLFVIYLNYIVSASNCSKVSLLIPRG